MFKSIVGREVFLNYDYSCDIWLVGVDVVFIFLSFFVLVLCLLSNRFIIIGYLGRYVEGRELVDRYIFILRYYLF